MWIMTIAECAETEVIVKHLKVLGVDYAQGHAFGSPRPMENWKG
jgi:EAL domain-containing protein (putative c-di-GMP-specific phosphodiesterase class I)